jgi:predicted transcriptional regulator
MKNNIERLMEEADITLDELSKITCIPIGKLDDIINGQSDPSLIDSYKIKKALNQDYIADIFLFDDLG